MKLIYGVGLNDLTEPTRYSKGVNTKDYNLWLQMLRRCYSETALKRNPTYKDCYVSENWLKFAEFAKEVRELKGFGNIDYELDKDLIIQNNKLYSADTVCFLPKSLISALTGDGSGTPCPIASGARRSRRGSDAARSPR